jgi:hypothetical protein
MIYIISFVVALLALSLVSSIQLWGGLAQFLPALMLLASSMGRIRLWFICFAALGFTGFFVALSIWYLVLVLLFSAITYAVFTRWVDNDNPLLSFIVLVVLLGAFIGALYFPAHPPLRTYEGSMLLSVPVLVAWLIMRLSKKRSL